MEAFFLPADGGARFCICHRAKGTPRGGVLYLHPFAEEMNKSRRMAALQARAFANAGFTVLLIDLHGCGDSSGSFSDATWPGWIHDAERGLAWLRGQARGPYWAWGLRAGCLLASALAMRPNGPDRLLFWQPPGSGKLLLQQFIRLRTAMEALDGGAKGVGEAMRVELAQGKTVDIAGYALAPGLAAGLEQATLAPPAHAGRLHWLETTIGDSGQGLPPVSSRTMSAWQAAGWSVHASLHAGPAFWQSTEVELAPELIAATVSALAGAVA